MQRGRERFITVACGVGVVALSWSLAAAAGAAAIARTDDWSYARVAFGLHRAGSIRLVGWGQMTLVGLAVWAQPWLMVLGDHRWVLDLSVAVLMASGLIAATRIARVVLSPARAAVAIGALVAFPGVLRDATTFMTDGPALALQLLTLAAGIAAMGATGRRRGLLLAACLVIGVWAFSVREVAVAAPVAVLMAELVSARSRRRRLTVVGALALLAGTCALVWHWRQGLPGGQAYNGRAPFTVEVTILASAVVTACLGLAPALAGGVARWWRLRHLVGRSCGALVGLAVVGALPVLAWHRHAKNWWLLGDYLQANGMNGDKLALGVRPDVLPTWLWRALVIVAVVATIVAAALVGEWVATRWRRRPRTAGFGPADHDHRMPGAATVRLVLTLHVALYALILAGAAVLNGTLFDRYLSPIVFSGSVLVLAGRGSTPEVDVARRVRLASRATATAALGLVAVTSLLLTVDSDAFDGARWRAGRAAVAAGFAADTVDAGFEWVGAHATGSEPGLSGEGPLSSWWSVTFGLRARCAVVTASPASPDHAHEIGVVTWRPMLVGRRDHLHVYVLDGDPRCLRADGSAVTLPGPA